MHQLKEKQTVLFPTRVVKTCGDVVGAENLTQEKPLALLPTFTEPLMTRLSGAGSFVLLDFGRELHGSLRILSARTSQLQMKLRLVFGESVSEALSQVGERGATNHHSPRDIVVDIANLSSLEFGRTGFRFCRIETVADDTVWLKAAVAVCKTADIPQKGFVRTSDARFNEILDTALYTCYLNIQDGVIWDGIKRDRMVWSGDLNTEILTAGYMYGMIPNIKNCLELLRHETPDDVWINHIPSYSVWWIRNLVDYVRLSGDMAYYKANLDYVAAILRDLDICIGETRGDIDMQRSGKRTHRPFFLDWPTADREDAFVGTMMLTLYTLRGLRELGGGVDLALVDHLIRRIAIYGDLRPDMKEAIAMQVCCGTGAENACALLEADGANGFSTFMMYFILRALDTSGSDKTLSLCKDYYGGMLDRGATAFWEDFHLSWLDGSGRIDEETPVGLSDLHADYGDFCYKGLRHSLCHGWSCGVVAYAVEQLLGITILSPGFDRVRIRPDLHGLDSVEGRIPTPHGDIEVSLRAGAAPVIRVPDGIVLVQ